VKITRSSLKRTFSFSWRDLLVSAAILLCATGACALLHQTADTIDGFASPVYVLAVLLISRFTSGYLFGLIAAVLGVIGVNYVFTYPYMAFNFTISGYPLTMFTFLVVSLVTIAPAATTRPASIQSQPANRWTSFHNGGLFTVKENRRASLASSVQSNMWEPSSISTRPRMQGV